MINGHASIHDVAAGHFPPLLRYFWVVAPDQSAIGSIQRIHNAPVAGHIHDAVNYQRSCLQPAVVIGIEVPIEAKVGDVVAVYLGQAAISLLIIIKPIAEPITFRREAIRAVSILRVDFSIPTEEGDLELAHSCIEKLVAKTLISDNRSIICTVRLGPFVHRKPLRYSIDNSFSGPVPYQIANLNIDWVLYGIKTKCAGEAYLS